ncbi:hypothetical protein VPH35_110438 [Triticum aestivum]
MGTAPSETPPDLSRGSHPIPSGSIPSLELGLQPLNPLDLTFAHKREYSFARPPLVRTESRPPPFVRFRAQTANPPTFPSSSSASPASLRRRLASRPAPRRLRRRLDNTKLVLAVPVMMVICILWLTS